MSLVALSPTLTGAIKAQPDRTIELTMDPARDAQMAQFGYKIERVLPEFPVVRLSLEKDWHLVHFVLTGEAWGSELPLGFLQAGTELGEDVGYGPGRLLEASEVIAVNDALDASDFDAVVQKLTIEDLQQAEIYALPPQMPISEVKEHLIIPAYSDLRQFVQQAAASGCSVFLSIS